MILNYRSLGEGPPILLLHGLFGSLDNWMTLSKQLSSDFTVYLVDLRNHGQSFHSNQFDYNSMVMDIKRLADTLNIGVFSLLGHSMGGKVSMFYASQYPETIDKLIVVDMAPRHYPVHHQQILKGLSTIDPLSLASRNEADTKLQAYVNDEGVRQFLLKNLKRNSNGSFSWKINLQAISSQIENVGEGLPSSAEVDVPTLFIRGGDSEYISDEDIHQINRQFPNSTVSTVPGVGHWVHAEAPGKLLEMVKEFLD